MSSELRELQWGQTPFDDLSIGELIDYCQEFFAAAIPLVGLLKRLRGDPKVAEFWGRAGLGGRAIEAGNQALAKARNGALPGEPVSFLGLSREELLRHCQRFYDATKILVSALEVIKHGTGPSPHWERDGEAGRRLYGGRDLLDAVEKGFDTGSIYQSFFRYARDLLFDQGNADLAFGWMVCSKCGVMLCHDLDETPSDGDSCQFGRKDCPGAFRPLTWEDLKAS